MLSPAPTRSVYSSPMDVSRMPRSLGRTLTRTWPSSILRSATCPSCPWVGPIPYASGISYWRSAIPVNLVRGVMEQILMNGHVVRGWLGFVPQDMSEEQSAQIGTAGGGVTVGNIMVDSQAYQAGVRPG